MFIKNIHLKIKCICIIAILILLCFCISFIFFYLHQKKNISVSTNSENENKNDNDFIKWVDFTIPSNVLKLTADLDITSHIQQEETTYNWIELLAYLACIYGGNFDNFNFNDLDSLVEILKSGKSMDELTETFTFYNYYLESYSAVLGGFIGDYSIEVPKSNETTNEISNNKVFENHYGLKAFLPIAKNYYFTHYKDFGNSRSYGFKRTHLGNDLMGSIGTPIIAVESGIVEQLGWNQYGGWRIGIRSFDGKRYYYYAHLRKDHPYVEGLEKGDTIKAGDVIGYLGMTRI